MMRTIFWILNTYLYMTSSRNNLNNSFQQVKEAQKLCLVLRLAISLKVRLSVLQLSELSGKALIPASLFLRIQNQLGNYLKQSRKFNFLRSFSNLWTLSIEIKYPQFINLVTFCWIILESKSLKHHHQTKNKHFLMEAYQRCLNLSRSCKFHVSI